MKRVITLLFTMLLSLTLISAAEPCSLDVTLLNQDPYPAVPGDYAKLVFQIEGMDNPECSDITFTLLEDYPIEFDPGETGIKTFKKVDYIKNYESNILVPYEVRINEEAIDGESPIEAKVQSKGLATVTKTFDLEIEDVHADFEVYVKDYDYSSKELTLEILNIESSDVEALTIEIPKQENIIIKGSSRIVVGDLDSNEYTTADFEATPTDGEIKLNLIYSDSINVRRTVEKTIYFDSSYFTGRSSEVKKSNPWFYVVVVIVLFFIIRAIYKKIKKGCKKKN